MILTFLAVVFSARENIFIVFSIAYLCFILLQFGGRGLKGKAGNQSYYYYCENIVNL